MGKVGAIEKDRTNTMGKYSYKFRGIDDLYNALQPHLVTAGVFCTSEVIAKEREERESNSGGNLIYTILTMRFTFYAEDGSSVSSVTVGEAMDSGDKSGNKAMSTAYKYALMQIFCIPTEEEKDTEYQSPEVKAKKEVNSEVSASVDRLIAKIKGAKTKTELKEIEKKYFESLIYYKGYTEKIDEALENKFADLDPLEDLKEL